jgi:hypothetical protein
MRIRWLCVKALVAWAALCGFSEAAAVDIYRFNLDPLIDQSARRPERFAVDVARRIDSETSGNWVTDQSNATWTYSIQIPSAVSLAFHANLIRLPKNGVLTMSAAGQTYTYRASELRRSELWSRLGKGDQIAIKIVVPKAERHQTLLQIASFQAGYRSLSPDVEDNAHFKSIKAKIAAASAGCVENYVCDATPATQDAANASAVVIVANQIECTGTLVNDVPQDGAPYILTARHCENGADAGGEPGAAASVQVYWGSVTPCGQTLLPYFDSYTQTQSGATTVVEQQDQWLIRLDTAPVLPSVYYAGWDASGAPLVGGYSIEDANALTQQYVTWAGPAITETVAGSTLSLGYTSVFWGVVNSLGSVDHGASGSGLFTSSNQVVGSLSRAVVGACPVTPVPTPSANNAVALYSKLASTWISTADTTSTTGSKTLASVLDPAGTGATTLTGMQGTPVTLTLTTEQGTSQIGEGIDLSFEVTPASAVCTASGGASGDGWSGVKSTSVVPLTESQAGTVTYVLTCVSGSHSTSAHTTVVWTLVPPDLTLFDLQDVDTLYVGGANVLGWRSNQTSCVASGGAAGDGWTGTLPGTGQKSVTEQTPGTYLYTVTCGSGSQAVSQSLTVVINAPSATISLSNNPIGLRVGQTIGMTWSGLGGCTASGGGPGDGWGGSVDSFGVLYLKEQAAGTYTYTLTCGPVGVAAVAHATYTFTNAAPSASLTAPQSTRMIDLTAQSIPNLLSWTANVQPCEIDYTGPVSGTLVSGFLAQGSIDQPQQIAGQYTYTLTCGLSGAQATSTTTINWTQQPVPHVSLSSSGSEFLLTGGYLLWTTNVLPCVGSGGASGDGFAGPLPYFAGAGGRSQLLIPEATAGTYHFTITCGVGTTASAQTTVAYNNLGGAQLSLSPGQVQVVTGEPAMMTWNSAVGPCTGYDGAAGDGWNGPHPQQGSFTLIETVSNNYNISLVCGTGTAAVEAQAEIFVFPVSAVSVIFTSGYGGGGTVAVGHPVTLTWNSQQAATCTASGGNPGDGWSGAMPIGNGSATVVEATTGTVTYTLTCQNGALSAVTHTSAVWQAAPAVTLTSSTTQAVFGTPFTLTWAATDNANGCNESQDAANSSAAWGGTAANSGSASIAESSGAAHTYTMTCQSQFGAVQASVTVNFTAPATTGGGSSGGGTTSGGSTTASTSSSSHGGGGIDSELLAFLAALAGFRLLSILGTKSRRVR